ncbi:MAG TPA: BTAD domain-containing putative transcriptional regulator [Gemmatimonadales bacterium]|nr:BTAD domain-containing putative transcriptional regulator [Gemmatimonadales bacterium]
MFRLKTFGGLRLMGPDGVLVEHVQHRRMVLLALLAAAGEPGMTRDKLLLHLWPESDTEHGRGLLRQALHALRRDLKAPDLFLGTTDVRLNPQIISTDVGEFQELLRSGGLVGAVALYSGPFLDGVHLSDAPEFDRWADEKRSELARQAAGALEALATAASARGDHRSAAEWWARRAAMDPLNAGVTVALMEEMAASGNPAGALQQARIHEVLMREELSAEPHPDVVEAAERIRSAPPRSTRLSGPQPEVQTAPALPQVKGARVEAPQSGAFPPSGAVPPALSRSQIIGATAALALVVGLVIVLAWPDRDSAEEDELVADPSVVVVAPFRADVADSGLGYLREGLMDLLAAEFTGAPGPRAANPRTVMAAWTRASRQGTEPGESAAAELARDLGARYLVLGSVVGTARRLSISGALLETGTGNLVAQAAATGSEDSLPVLVDRIVGQLLVGLSGENVEDEERSRSFANVPLPALRAYLEGQVAYRRSRYAAAIESFERALEIDSTFALAALRLAMTGYWIRGAAWTDRLDLAWRLRERLAPRDRVLLDAIAGPRYPATAWWSEDLGAAERAVEVAPDRPEAWFLLGDVLFHLGPGLGRPDAWQQAEAAFRQAFALDSTFGATFEHLLELAAARGDTGQVRRLTAARLAGDSSGEHTDFLRWRAAVALGDSLGLRRVRQRFDRMPLSSLLRIVGTGQLEGIAPSDVDAAAAALRRRPLPGPDRWLSRRSLHYLALNRGRVAVATTEVPLVAEGEPIPRWADRLTVLDALFGDGHAGAAEAAAARLVPTGSSTPATGLERAARSADLCILELRRLLGGDAAGTPGVIARLRDPPETADSLGAARSDSLCALVLEAIYTEARDKSRAPAVLRALDSTMRLGPAVTNEVEIFANLVVARLYEALGDPRTALSAVRRRPFQWAYGPIFLTSFLHQEMRLAMLVDDTVGALRAGRHYLSLRTRPDPHLQKTVSQVRAEVAALLERASSKSGSRSVSVDE